MRFICVDGEEQYRDLLQDELGELLRARGASLSWYEEGASDSARWIELADGHDGILLIGSRPLPPGVLERCPSIRIVSYCGTGARKFVDLEEAQRCGIVVSNVPAYAAESVAEHAIALMLAVARRIVQGDEIVRSGRWEQHVGLTLAGRRIGIVGAGPIAAAVIERAKALKMEPVFWTRSSMPARARALGAESVELDELFRSSQVVSIHLAHVPETDRIIGRHLLRMLRRDAIFINTARAELVDNQALRELLCEEAIFGAGVDVFDAEPPDPGDLADVAHNLIVSPHVGYHTEEANRRLFTMAVENLLAFIDGVPTNLVLGGGQPHGPSIAAERHRAKSREER